MLTTIQVLVFGFALWFGLYLLARDAAKPGLRFAGVGLVSYGLGIGLDALSAAAMPEIALTITRWRWPLIFIPALCWCGAAVFLLPETTPLRAQVGRFIDRYLLLIALVFYLFAVMTHAFNEIDNPLYWILTALLAVLLLAALVLGWQAIKSQLPTRSRAIFAAATLFFGLGMGSILLPVQIVSTEIMLLAIGFDLALLGQVVAALDAFDEGELLLPDFLRSFGFSLFTALFFGGQVVLAMILGDGITFPLLTLLLVIITSAILTQVFSDPIQNLIDRVVFTRFSHVRRVRAEYRAAASALPRVNESLDLHRMDEAEFARLTRRALSHFGDLHRLAASPLTRLPVIDSRLAARGEQDNTLERAAELKFMLAESIQRLKPRDNGDFGTSDEWRYYNALYFPYVAGLKPYSRAADHDELDPASKAALEWFRAAVPERTLHNWQNAAARLVAQDLRERMIN